MSEVTQAAPVAEAQNTATELTQDTPEVVTPEATADEPEQVSEQDERDRAIKRMERRINKKHAEAAAASERARIAEERLQAYERQAPAETTEVDPKDFEKAVTERAQEIARIERFTKQCNDIAKTGRDKFSDFDKAVGEVASEIPLFDKRGGPTPAMQAVLEADNPPALLHYLGTNPDVAADLADLTPTQLARRLDRIERDMAAPKTSAAPKPLTPVKAAVSDNSLSSAKSDQEWADRRDAELREKRKRI